MSITKSAILSEVNKRTARAETNIDSQIKAVLLDICLTIPILHSEYTTQTIIGQKEYGLGGIVNLGNILSVDIDGKLLQKISSLEAYKSLIEDNTEADYGEPTTYLIEGQHLYLYPIPDKIYDLNVVVSEIDLDVDDIKLPAKYEECLIEGACFKVYESKGLANRPEAQAHFLIYQRLIGQLEAQHNSNKFVGKTAYRDLG
ncbi:MAG TPA: hypothetical protein ENN27_03165 [Candidatus Atribacteria bacterium]|nr:hypothetical protein [Candidatus Atribacteria bacterium]